MTTTPNPNQELLDHVAFNYGQIKMLTLSDWIGAQTLTPEECEAIKASLQKAFSCDPQPSVLHLN